MQKKIISGSEASVNASIEKGQFIRNGYNAVFELEEVTDNQVHLKSMSPGTLGKISVMARTLFVQLYARKNYDQVMNPTNYLREILTAHSVGATRFLVK